MSNCHVYLIDDNCEKHWVSAESETHAVEVHADNSGYLSVEEFKEDMGDFEVSQLPDDQSLSVGDFDEPNAPPVVKTCAQWAEGGPGIIATTCF
jgi:hypothetical protein